jgi:hypothetical protein
MRRDVYSAGEHTTRKEMNMAGKTTVVTPERFASGMTFERQVRR